MPNELEWNIVSTPAGQGFIAAVSIQLAGNVNVYLKRLPPRFKFLASNAGERISSE